METDIKELATGGVFCRVFATVDMIIRAWTLLLLPLISGKCFARPLMPSILPCVSLSIWPKWETLDTGGGLALH